MRLAYNPALDGLRAFAVLVVIAFHWNARWLPGGWIGVDVFFVLSGFLITRILTTEISLNGVIDLRRFYWRRAVRLTPALIFLLICVFLLAKFTGHSILKQILLSLTYTMNWARAFGLEPAPLLGHTWSLAIEEQFYLIWPVALGLMTVRRMRHVTVILLAAVLLWRFYLVAAGAPFTRTYNGFDTHADTLMIGALAALVPLPNPVVVLAGRWSWFPMAGLAACAVLLPNVSLDGSWPFIQALASPAVGLLTAAAIVGVERDGPLKRFLSARPLVYVGLLSYALYLWHYPLLRLALPYDPAWGVVAVGGAFAAAIFSRHYVELPAKRIGHSVFRRALSS